MFEKILIANRGEIACRVMRTARRLSIRTVAVFSECDADALHVRMADEAVPVGPAPPADSYLRIENILAAVKATGAEAVHPGYGFLAENPAFAEALADKGVAFIGPPAAAIAALGDKINAKRLADAAGVRTLPGHPRAVRGVNEAARAARAIGYPVLLKAAAGGGGKGMRVVGSDKALAEALPAAAGEARSSFGDDRVMIERYIEQPRHIEIQVLADAHGNCIHLGERECSIQRRHQKVIEEAPSPLIDAATRQAMGEQAVALARQVGYVSAGTVEFLVDQAQDFYFLEMNTRLQVEHPVTEMVTGLDLVELMIRIAAGEELAHAQAGVSLSGWAIEARLYAEDPTRGFLPSIGRLLHYRPPKESRRLRVDSGVDEGAEISMYYDPLMAKLIAWGDTREQAIATLLDALDDCYVRGVAHNLGFLSAVLAHPRFKAGRFTTGFIEEAYPDGFKSPPPDAAARRRLIAVAAALHRRTAERDASIGGRLAGRAPRVAEDWVVRLAGRNHPVSVTPADGGYDVVADGRRLPVRADWAPGEALFHGSIDGERVSMQVDRNGVGYRLSHHGVAVDALVLTPLGARLAAEMPAKPAPDTSRQLRSPMPGLLVQLRRGEGDHVKAGEALAVVEAMKMENLLCAERDGRIKTVLASPGDSLAVDQVILEFE
ncbi:MAG: acetyl-CoA carboxylase biotin carboxylase subunit [Kiloniellales bacterium]